MTDIEEKLRERARQLLESEEVTEVIAWGAGRFVNQTTPLFISEPAQADEIVFNDYCINILAKYAFTEQGAGRVAVAVRGCEARGINRMLADNQIKREQLFLLGIPCGGMKERLSGETLDRCKSCTHPNPVVYDEMLGEEPEGAFETIVASQTARFAEVEAVEAMRREQRREHFDEAFSRCIRCYACREVCPVCTCRECFVDQQRAGWQGKQNNLNENRFYNLTRVFHIADRCVECGECARACPMELPLMEVNRKMIKDLNTLFAAGEEGLTSELDNALGRYDTGDVEEFM
ncbi:MAG: 4Fe-4S dicluster domain-containing protein [Coriobacteriales bacterium]|jgi:ferredoxin|nr:4Fe-4S dicluster domain-containing protein [Coriobacteriales bacterium]